MSSYLGVYDCLLDWRRKKIMQNENNPVAWRYRRHDKDGYTTGWILTDVNPIFNTKLYPNGKDIEPLYLKEILDV